MPEISRFYGIVIKLFFGDHPPPHFHAVYGEYVGLFDIMPVRLQYAGFRKADKLPIRGIKEQRLVGSKSVFYNEEKGAYHLSLRELMRESSAALQRLKRTRHFLHVAPCSEFPHKALKYAS